MCFPATGKQQETYLILNAAMRTRTCKIYRQKHVKSLTCKVSIHSYPSTSCAHEMETKVLKRQSLSLTFTPDMLNQYQPPWILMYTSVKLFTDCVLCFNPWGNNIYCRCQKQHWCLLFYSTTHDQKTLCCAEVQDRGPEDSRRSDKPEQTELVRDSSIQREQQNWAVTERRLKWTRGTLVFKCLSLQPSAGPRIRALAHLFCMFYLTAVLYCIILYI